MNCVTNPGVRRPEIPTGGGRAATLRRLGSRTDGRLDSRSDAWSGSWIGGRRLRMAAAVGIAVTLLATGCGRVIRAERPVEVIPRPVEVVEAGGCFRITGRTACSLAGLAEGSTGSGTGEGLESVSADRAVGKVELEAVAAALDDLFTPCFGHSPRWVEQLPQRGGIRFERCDTLAAGGYRLAVRRDGITIHAADAAGAYYAVQTLRQLLPTAALHPDSPLRAVEIPEVTISDHPCMAYRGLMLDVARHFFTVDEVKRTLDLMALHKMNVFHWHLTDDQGWRIEILRYPELTRVGSVRRRTLIGKDPGGEYDESCRYDETPYGGYYTQEEIREVVDYAARRFITVIPEIEFPGHAVAALASYPWLGCTGERYEVRQTWDIDDRVFCPGRESTFEFIEGVLDEVMELFPSEWIHIGGDECPTKMWARCPHCRERVRTEHIADLRGLQGYATARIERFLQARGRQLIGWDEILEGGVTPTAVVMSWRGTEGGVQAARQGNRVVMSPSTYCYFDYYQTRDTASEPLAWGGFLPLERVYAFDPLEGLDPGERRCVLGVQANLWTEYIPNFDQAQYMLLPRLSALAEVGWSLDRRDSADFRRRLDRQAQRFDALGYRYARHAFKN